MYTITCARFDKNPLQNPSPDGTPARHRRDILIYFFQFVSFARLLRAFCQSSLDKRCDRINSQLSRVVACYITRSLYGSRPATPCDGGHWSAFGGVTAALVGYRLSMLVTKCEAYTAVAPRPRVTGDIGRLSRVDIR